jgi:hypothetical protein
VEIAMTPNDFLKILLNASNKCTDPPPNDWHSRDQLGKMWNVKKTICWTRISKGIELGLIEKKTFYIPDMNGTMKPVPHYYFLDKKPNKKTCIK